MNKIIHFNYGSGVVSIVADKSINLPKIGESVNMSYIITDEKEIEEFHQTHGQYSIQIHDISHSMDFKNKEHHIDISLTNDFSTIENLFLTMAN